MKIRKPALAVFGLGATALVLSGGIGPASAGTGDDKPKLPVTCSLKADAGPFAAARCLGEGAVQFTVFCPADEKRDMVVNMFAGRSMLLLNRCHKGPTLAALTMFDVDNNKPGEVLVPMQQIA
ncbi:hypothetical protein AGRA3207_005036 [Actinomadura graeca]|uniref:Secreted protein n=1 Tax=Actinomadura graeca TaxID=2750812 RepID=A0ABX8QYH4_9ACTN|nr:hypothetical protein [Actinomadura graeca]QXJ23825.1 hypothetical protein AGRA3207_005036 [Actinomadura graeca]